MKRGRPHTQNSHANERRQEIKNFIEEMGLWNFGYTEFAKKHNVSRQTIQADVKAVLRGIPEQDLKEIKINVTAGYRKAIKEMQRIMATGTNDEKIKASKAFADVESKFNQMLEAHGIKDKVADRIEISATELAREIFKKQDPQSPS